jgi:hypothetical protein
VAKARHRERVLPGDRGTIDPIIEFLVAPVVAATGESGSRFTHGGPGPGAYTKLSQTGDVADSWGTSYTSGKVQCDLLLFASLQDDCGIIRAGL